MTQQEQAPLCRFSPLISLKTSLSSVFLFSFATRGSLSLFLSPYEIFLSMSGDCLFMVSVRVLGSAALDHNFE